MLIVVVVVALQRWLKKGVYLNEVYLNQIKIIALEKEGNWSDCLLMVYRSRFNAPFIQFFSLALSQHRYIRARIVFSIDLLFGRW